MSPTAKMAVLQMIIHRPRWALLAGLFLAVALAAAGLRVSDPKPGPKPTPFEDALHQAEANLKTPEGQRYDFIVGQQFARNYEMVMMGCTESAAQKDLVPFDLVFQVAANGSVRKVLVNPETKVAVCVEKQVAAGKFKKPPKPLYWVHVGMNLSP